MRSMKAGGGCHSDYSSVVKSLPLNPRTVKIKSNTLFPKEHAYYLNTISQQESTFEIVIKKKFVETAKQCH